MTVWTPVEPISDEPAPKADYWPTFKIGDRVRVRLSGECQVSGPGIDYDDPDTIRPDRGHVPWHEGLEGTVRPCLARTCAGFNGHTIVVACKAPNGMEWFGHFAAAELEPLP